MTITVRDLQGKTVVTHSETTIRKAWVLQAPQSMKDKFKLIPQKERFELYAAIDADVRTKWTDLLREYRESLAQKGIVPILDAVTGVSALPEQYQIETEDFLIKAAEFVLAEMATA